ncbi:hypothetical protein MMC24_006628 [Lignoscripta atroalba]|nr:hypothetical protein [Lignoscripta atroalba]
MLDDLRKMSEAYVSENRANVEQGYRGSPSLDVRVVGKPNVPTDLSYAESETRRRQDGSILSSVDRWPSPASVYPGDNNYTMHSGYPPENVYPPGGPGYSTGLGYTTAAGPISGHPAYTYEHPGVGEYPPQGYAYAPASMYGGRGQPRDPGLPVGYYSGTSAPEMSGRGARVDEGYGQYYETQPLPSPAGRGGYNVPGRGNPSAYDIPQAREYATRQEPTRDAYGGNRRR